CGRLPKCFATRAKGGCSGAPGKETGRHTFSNTKREKTGHSGKVRVKVDLSRKRCGAGRWHSFRQSSRIAVHDVPELRKRDDRLDAGRPLGQTGYGRCLHWMPSVLVR